MGDWPEKPGAVATFTGSKTLQADNVRPPPVDGQELRNGCVVRVNSGPDQGKAAVVKKINPTKTKLQSGIRTVCALVEFSDEDQVSVPLANLDILE